MKLNYSKLYFSFLFFAFFFVSSYSQDNSKLWSANASAKLEKAEIIFSKERPNNSTLVNLNLNQFKNALINVPKRSEYNKNEGVVLSFPNPKGELQSYLVVEASVMKPELQAQFPEIRSFVGKGVNNSTSIIRFSISPEKGLSSMVLSDEKTVFIEPYSKDLKTYIVFSNSIADQPTAPFICETEYVPSKLNLSDEQYAELKNANDGTLRTYDLALACTVEYSQFHGGTLSNVMAAMNTTMTRVNGVFERDLGLTMEMVPNTSIIFLGPDVDSDPYTNSSGSAMLNQNQTTCDSNIGFNNYDIGHVFSTGGGGIAQLNSPCSSNKAKGVTGQSSPVGDAFDIDYVAHEIGHQFGGNHTQNNNCQRSGVSVEPGSASTIMGYAGICFPNVQNNSDDYFHGENIKEMWANISAGTSSTCFTASATNNAAPVSIAGADYSIPKSTAFVLKGDATDSDTDARDLTYCWEQIDAAPAQMPPLSTNTGGPAFRSLDPNISPNRYMPALSTVMSGSLSSTWEVIPSVGRTMNFSLTVRDNELNGAATSSDEMLVSVEDVTPFTVNTPPAWAPNSSQQVSWVVGETDNSIINCQTVNILFTINNGISFTTLASGVPNTGSATITVPNVATTNNAKVLIEAADNIFYAVSEAFPISTEPDYSISSTTGDLVACNIDAVTYEFNFSVSNGYSENTSFSVTGIPSGATFNLSPANLSDNGTVTLDISGLNSVAETNYTITLTATSSITKSSNVNLLVTDDLCESNGNLDFQTRITRVSFNTIDNEDTSIKTMPYSDYTSISTDVEAGSNYDLIIEGNSDGSVQVITRVWIDWNQNCSFNDPGETYDLGTAFGLVNEPVGTPFNISVPNDAAEGTTLMRVGFKYTPNGANQFPTACETGYDGEVEDYTLNVLNNLGVEDALWNGLIIYPNPNKGEFKIDFSPNTGEPITVEVFDIRGRKLQTKQFNAQSRFSETITLNSAEPGVYLVQISDGSQKVTQRVIVE
ncbi:MAG: T9SS type A sorting domain-containing protein [Winogradskyella sp.]|uniref:zinc-dependent metalloprotease n=1 Tax=Winogradskyella sp. TaxID=1883156 RepID=UPI0017EA1885|nr:T9SS type A sorting domain-containing protein [Winogradskyella sp.]